MILRLLEKEFDPHYNPTLEDSFRKTLHSPGGNDFVLNIYDTAGQEVFYPVRDQYIRIAEGFIIVYAVTRRSSFKEEPILLDKCETITTTVLPMIIIGTHTDQKELREVSIREGIELAKNRNVLYLELSNVFEIDAILTGFEVIASLIINEKEKKRNRVPTTSKT